MSEQVVSWSMTSSTCRFVLNIVRNAEGAFRVKACEISAPDFTNRSTFGKKNQLEDVLNEDLARSLIARLQDVSDEHQVLSFPEFIVELPGLILAHAHVVAAETRNGVQSILVRFRHFIGALNYAFKATRGLTTSIAEQNERIATDMINDISMPLLNLVRSSAMEISMPMETAKGVIDRLAFRAQEIEFHIELIKRYARSLSLDSPSSFSIEASSVSS